MVSISLGDLDCLIGEFSTDIFGYKLFLQLNSSNMYEIYNLRNLRVSENDIWESDSLFFMH